MKTFKEKDAIKFIKSLRDGKPGVILCITEDHIADFGNNIDAKSLLLALQEFSLIVSQNIDKPSKRLEA